MLSESLNYLGEHAPSLISRHHYACVRKGSGDIGGDSWFCKLNNHVIICIGFLLAHVRSRNGAQDQENAPMSPDPFSHERLGSGNETSMPSDPCRWAMGLCS